MDRFKRHMFYLRSTPALHVLRLHTPFVGVAELPALQVGDQVPHAAHKVLTLGLDRALHHHRVGEEEVGRAHRLA